MICDHYRLIHKKLIFFIFFLLKLGFQKQQIDYILTGSNKFFNSKAMCSLIKIKNRLIVLLMKLTFTFIYYPMIH